MTLDRGGARRDHRRMPDYRVSLGELEASAHVPAEEQVSELAEAPGESPVTEAEANRMRLLGVVGDGRW